VSIRAQIEAYARNVRLRFHTPGHMGRLHPDDITEIDGVFPEHCIEAAEQAAATAYGVRRLRFLVCGSSMGVKAAILAVGKPLLCEDICHRAVDEGATLARVPLYKLTRRRMEGLSIPPAPEELDAALKRHPDVGAVVLTSPDYYGRCVSQATFDVVRAHKKTLIVDGAHGAHFAFSPLFPSPPCRVADYCNMSAHKTLAAYTQTAYLAVNADPAPVDRALRLLGTTSPSYLFLSALEEAVEQAKQADYAGLKVETDRLRRKFAFADNDDFSRLVLDARPFGLDGHALYKRLLERGVAAETADARYVILIATPCNADDLPALGRILERFDER
jgi:arginine/lysine/ornithine decarboxylase